MPSLFHQRPQTPLPVEPVPTVFPKIEGADLAATFSGQRVAGDFYDVIRVSPERILFGLLDVSGRRDDNRAILAAAQEIFRREGTALFSSLDLNESDAMTRLCLHLNRGLIDSSHGVRSCPAFIGCYHERFGTLCYTNAGHTPGLLRDARGVAELPSTGLPLGLFSHATCDAPTVGLEKGSVLLLVSRGLLECGRRPDRDSEEFGLNRLKTLFASAPAQSAQSLCATTMGAANQFNGHAPLCDDRTALALIRNS